MYGNEEFWQALTNHEETSLSKQAVIIRLAIALGLRLPSEPSAKFMCSLWMVANENRQRCDNMSSIEKRAVYLMFKAELQKACKRAPEPLIFCSDLPDSPGILYRDFQPLYNSAFGADCSRPRLHHDSPLR